MYETISLKIEGTAPLIMHNGRMRDPLDRYAKALKALTGKRKKSDEDHFAIARLEWEAGLYWAQDTGPYIPSRTLRKLLIEGARKSKDGKTVEAHVMAVGPAKVQYEGPRDIEGLWNEGRSDGDVISTHVDRRIMTVQRNAVARTRPIFQQWAAEIVYTYDSGECQPDQIRQWLAQAGHHVGLLDGRPESGRFIVADET